MNWVNKIGLLPIYRIFTVLVVSFQICPADSYAEPSYYLPKISGFGSVGMGISDNAEPYLRDLEVSNRLSVAGFNKVGMQLNGWLPKGNSYMIQLLGKNSNDHFDIKLDWMLLSREITPEFTVRAGLLRLPMYLYSKSIEVGKTYPWILPPEAVYGTTETTNYHGVDLIYRKSFEKLSFELQPLIGETQDTLHLSSQIGLLELEAKSSRNFGVSGRVLGPNYIFHGSYVRIDNKGPLSIVDTGLAESNKSTVIQGTYEIFAIAVKIEFGDWHYLIESSHRGTSNDDITNSVDGYYFMMGYRNRKFLYHVTYSVWYDDNDFGQFIGNRDTKETIVGINYDLDSNQTLKLQLNYGDPKNGSIGFFRKRSPDIDDVSALMVNYNWVF